MAKVLKILALMQMFAGVVLFLGTAMANLSNPYGGAPVFVALIGALILVMFGAVSLVLGLHLDSPSKD